MPSTASTIASSSAKVVFCALRQVAPVGVHVLAQQRDLASRRRRPGARPPPPAPPAGATPRARAWTGTMQYEQRQLQPTEICTQPWNSRSRLHRQVAGEALELEVALRGEAVAGQELGQPVHLARAERHVHERELLEHLRPSSTATSSRRRRSPARGPRTSAAWPRPGGRPAGVGLLADRAGVEEDQVGVRRGPAPRRSRATRACPSCARSRARSSGTRRWSGGSCASLPSGA